MARYFPVRTLTGLAYPWVDTDFDLGTVSQAETIVKVDLTVTDAPSGASIIADIRSATGGGGSGITVTIADGQKHGSATGSVSIASGGRIYLRVTSAPAASGINLAARCELSG